MGIGGATCVGIFSVTTIVLFGIFIYLLSNVDPEIRPRPGHTFGIGSAISPDMGNNLEDLLKVESNEQDTLLVTTEGVEQEKDNEDNEVETSSEPERRKSGRRSKVVVRIVDKNFNVVKVLQKTNNGTIDNGTNTVTNATNTTSKDSLTTPPVKGVRRSANDEMNKLPKVILLKLLPNNTFIFEEDIEI